MRSTEGERLTLGAAEALLTTSPNSEGVETSRRHRARSVLHAVVIKHLSTRHWLRAASTICEWRATRSVASTAGKQIVNAQPPSGKSATRDAAEAALFGLSFPPSGSICECATRKSFRDGRSSSGSPLSGDCTPVTHGVPDSQSEPKAIPAERGRVGNGHWGTARVRRLITLAMVLSLALLRAFVVGRFVFAILDRQLVAFATWISHARYALCVLRFMSAFAHRFATLA
ncbi:hypothetical protein R1flu_000032 [Riccia fluitans]|uniref:Uncharacterized protein n=1 Tax=Riccia fluitans TaxID=41844 RepID=A0ABD1XZA6_9MARC